MQQRKDAIRDIRKFNRFYTRILGLLDQHILDSGYSLAEARILYELSETNGCIASDLSARLSIDKSYLSRMLHKFEQAGLVRRESAGGDARAILLSLTAKGRKCCRALNKKSNKQMFKLIDLLPEEECRNVRAAMDTIRKGFSKAGEIAIRPYQEADIGFVIEYQIQLYVDYGFTSDAWKGYVQGAVLDFHKTFAPAKDRMWIVETRGVRAGCIAITHADDHTAQLRFFFVDSALRGRGIGNRLMELALMFCREKGYRHVFLLTCSKLLAARHLYEKYGFALTDTRENPDWGEPMIEEQWDLDLPKA